MPLKILVLSFYYPPDLAAGSFRTEAMVKALREQYGDRVFIDVLTTQPNRYHSYHEVGQACETSPGMRIRRISLPDHQSGFLDQAKAFFYYAWGVNKATRGRKYDVILATSSRLMTAALGRLIARKLRIPLYLDIRDIFVENLPEMLPFGVGRPLSKCFALIEKWTIKGARKVSLVSAGFLPYFTTRYPSVDYSIYTNGVDDLFLTSLESCSGTASTSPLRIVYAGNIGAGQGLHHVIPELAARLGGKATFKIIGDGGAVEALRTALKEHDAERYVELCLPVPRAELVGIYEQADVLFLHLNSYSSLKSVLPSKLFEYAAMGKPIWAGLDGYSADFVLEQIENAAVFPPCDTERALEALAGLTLAYCPRAGFKRLYARDATMRAMVEDVILVASNP